MEEKIKKILEDIKFANRFKGLSEYYNDHENSKTFPTSVVKRLFKEKGINLKYYSEKSFIKEIEFVNFQFRVLFKFRKGFNEGFFVFTNKNSEDHLYNRFNSFAAMIDPDFTYDKYNMIPVATCIEDLEAIVIEYYSLYQDVLKELLKKEKLEENEIIKNK